MAHTLQLVLKDAFSHHKDNLKSVKKVVSKLKLGILKMTYDSITTGKGKTETLQNSCETRFSSSVTMAETYLNHMEHIRATLKYVNEEKIVIAKSATKNENPSKLLDIVNNGDLFDSMRNVTEAAKPLKLITQVRLLLLRWRIIFPNTPFLPGIGKRENPHELIVHAIL
jgi:hypothetical protein